MKNWIKLFSTIVPLFLLSVNTAMSQISWKEIFPWEVDMHDSVDYYAQFSIAASDSHNATVVGYIYHDAPFPNARLYYLIKRTKDGGNSWIVQNSSLPNFYDQVHSKVIENIFAVDSLRLFAVGDSGLILKTTDAGSTWNQIGKPIKNKFLNVCFSDFENGALVGNYGSVWITNDGGATWKKKELLTQSTFHIVKAFKNGCYYVFDKYYFRLFRTFNDGTTWDSIQIVDKTLKDTLISETHSVYFFDSLHFILAGGHQDQNTAGFQEHRLMIETKDGGITWVELINDTSVHLPILSVAFGDNMTGIATSGYGANLITSDGGKNWNNCDIDPSLAFVGNVVFLDKKNFLAINGQPGFYSSLVSGTLLAESVSLPANCPIFFISPNPIREKGEINFTLTENKHLHIECFDLLGRSVKLIADENFGAGQHSLSMDFSSQPIGLYTIIYTDGNERISQSVIVSH